MASAVDKGVGGVTSKFWLLLTVSPVSSLIMLDPNIVARSLSAIGRSRSAFFSDVQRVISAHVVTYAALLLASSNYANLHGRKTSVIIGLAVFATARSPPAWRRLRSF